MFFDWWRKLVRVGSKVSRRERRKPPHLRRASFKPWVEMLEDRTLLSPGNVSITPNPSLLN